MTHDQYEKDKSGNDDNFEKLKPENDKSGKVNSEKAIPQNCKSEKKNLEKDNSEKEQTEKGQI